MAEERIGTTQHWILIHTYLKTTKKKLPDDWKRPRLMESKKLGAFFWRGLYKSEVFLNYFQLERGYKMPQWIWDQGDYPIKVDAMAEYFDGRGQHISSEARAAGRNYTEADYIRDTQRKKAVASYTRTKANMVKKGLIEVEPGLGPNAERITLTKAGKAKAKEIIESEK